MQVISRRRIIAAARSLRVDRAPSMQSSSRQPQVHEQPVSASATTPREVLRRNADGNGSCSRRHLVTDDAYLRQLCCGLKQRGPECDAEQFRKFHIESDQHHRDRSRSFGLHSDKHLRHFPRSRDKLHNQRDIHSGCCRLALCESFCCRRCDRKSAVRHPNGHGK